MSTSDKKIEICLNCQTTQRTYKCDQRVAAKLVIAKDSNTYNLVAFLPIIKLIIQDDVAIDEYSNIATKLLMSDPFSFTFDKNNIIIKLLIGSNSGLLIITYLFMDIIIIIIHSLVSLPV